MPEVDFTDAARWRYPGHVDGADAAAARATAAAIEEPLTLHPWPAWDPADAWPLAPDEPIPTWVEPILAAGPRPAFEFEQVIPGEDLETIYDPIIEAGDRARAGEREGARRLLRSLIATDPRCLDGHAHLGGSPLSSAPSERCRSSSRCSGSTRPTTRVRARWPS